MTSVLVPIGVLILLFLIYGLVRPGAGCAGHCSSCSGAACNSSKEESHV